MYACESTRDDDDLKRRYDNVFPRTKTPIYEDRYKDIFEQEERSRRIEEDRQLELRVQEREREMQERERERDREKDLCFGGGREREERDERDHDRERNYGEQFFPQRGQEYDNQRYGQQYEDDRSRRKHLDITEYRPDWSNFLKDMVEPAKARSSKKLNYLTYEDKQYQKKEWEKYHEEKKQKNQREEEELKKNPTAYIAYLTELKEWQEERARKRANPSLAKKIKNFFKNKTQDATPTRCPNYVSIDDTIAAYLQSIAKPTSNQLPLQPAIMCASHDLKAESDISDLEQVSLGEAEDHMDLIDLEDSADLSILDIEDARASDGEEYATLQPFVINAIPGTSTAPEAFTFDTPERLHDELEDEQARLMEALRDDDEIWGDLDAEAEDSGLEDFHLGNVEDHLETTQMPSTSRASGRQKGQTNTVYEEFRTFDTVQEYTEWLNTEKENLRKYVLFIKS